ncbi:MAG: CRISPR-associated endonuclease Cas1 [Microthrixaceae bacterium]
MNDEGRTAPEAAQAVDEGVPALVPVRMLNEFVYCPRLFYLEWVSGQFVDNDFTVDGRWQHRAVDQERGAAPAAGDDLVFREATSVALSSEHLGLIGKADVIQGDGDLVVPIDVKRGSPARCAERVWLPERVQLGALGLLLRENEYRCERGAVFFMKTRERVWVQFDDDLVETTLDSLRSLRVAASSNEPPPPLEGSPKCDGCSLAGICLPDETLMMRRQRLSPPRRLMASDPSTAPMYVTKAGAKVAKKGDRVEVRFRDEVLSSTRLIDVSQLCVYGNVQVTTQLVRTLMSRDAPIFWFSTGAWLSGITEGLPGKHVELRRRQYRLGESAQAVEVAGAMIDGKIRNSRTLLRRNSSPRDEEVLRSLKRLARKAASVESAESLLGYEGTAARLYFGQFQSMIRSGGAIAGEVFSFSGRNRRPPRDGVNALLSFCYSLLLKECVAALRMVGFDPYFGVLHRPRFGRPALALDLSEEFRPLVAESVVLTLLNNGEVRPSGFVVRAGGVAMTNDCRRTVIGRFERRMSQELTHPVFGYAVSYRRAVELQARILAAVTLGELDRYEPLTTR